MEEIKVSVIIPVYNAQKHLAQCLQSVINQTLREIEIICVDDGSTDASPQILADFAAKDRRVILKHQQNRYAGAARNNGMETARGKYLAFWDADDYFEKNALALLYAKCEKERADMCLCAAYSVDAKSGRRAVDESFLKRRFLPKKSVFSIETDPEYIFNIASNTPWQRLLRADFVREHGLCFQNLRHANDTYFSLMATYFAKRITYTEKPLVNYRTNNSESVTGRSSAAPLCAYEAYAAAYAEMEKHGISEKARQSLDSKLLSGLLRELMMQTEQGAMQTVYSKIQTEGIACFGLDRHTDPDYYYFKSDFEDLVFLKTHTLSEFLMYKYKKERETSLFYKNKAERSPVIRLARRAARLLPANSSFYDKGKRLLRFK